MTMWELAACVDGFNRANAPSEDLAPPTDEEFDRMLEAYDAAHATKQ
jgi:transposase